MNKKMLLVLLLVAVLALSLAVAGCKSADTPQEQTPQEGGEVIENPPTDGVETSHLPVWDGKYHDPYSQEEPKEGVGKYHDDQILVVLDHQASIDSLAMDSLLDLDWGEEVVEVRPRYIFQDEVVKKHLFSGDMDNQEVVDYQRSLYLVLLQPDEKKVDELTATLPLREDIVAAEKVPVIVTKALSIEEQDAFNGQIQNRPFTMYDDFSDNLVWLVLTTEASRKYYDMGRIDWGFDFECKSVEVLGLSADRYDQEDWRICFRFELSFHDKQYVLDIVDSFRKHDYVYGAYPNYRFEIISYVAPNDPEYTTAHYQGIATQAANYGIIHLQDAWNITTGLGSIKIGIMGHLVDCLHEDLTNNISIAEDLYSTGNHRIHETLVAGVAGAEGDNNKGVAGVCWDVGLAVYHVSEADGPDSNITDVNAMLTAFNDARQDGVKIMNMSFGFYHEVPQLYTAIQDFPGLVVCAAGNEGWNLSTSATRVYPGEYDLDNIIVVAAGNQDDNYRWIGTVKSSNYSGVVDIYAPGENVWTTTDEDIDLDGVYTHVDYFPHSGTSLAAPMVAGVAALMLSIKPNMTGTMLKAALLDQADNLNWGDLGVVKRLNAYNSLSYLVDGHTHTYGYVGDAARHYYMCTICGLGAVGSDHNYSHSHTTESHTSYCSTCGFTPTYMAPYVFRDNGDGTHTYHCSYCDYECFTSAHDYVLANRTATTHAYRCRFCYAYVVSPHTYDCTDNEDGTHTGTCSVCDYSITQSHTIGYRYDATNHYYGCTQCDYTIFPQAHTITVGHYPEGHLESCGVCGYSHLETGIFTYLQHNDTYHYAHCQLCNVSVDQLHVWEQQSMIAYRCTKCGKRVVGVPIVHDNIEIPEGTMSGGGSEGVPFVYQDHWYVLVDGKLYILTEEYGELPLE